MQINREFIDGLTDKVSSLFKDSNLSNDMKKNIRAIIESNLKHLDVVSQQEFDAQLAVLERTRAKLDRLEKQLADLESNL